ncbi:hypothetical protein [Arthrobacter sp. H14]|uniref:hypothetical protein n=1 Tax=Arthrobacter sp. H14 TaxID=1312959 RepID=UPI00047D265B|nr:hypothetical protein [Arthrobacter sp. H14]
MRINREDQDWDRDHDTPVAPHPFLDRYWQELTIGDRVVVEIISGRPVSGHVDAITEDRSVLWVQFDEGQGRRLFHRQDNVILNRGYVDSPQKRRR